MRRLALAIALCSVPLGGGAAAGQPQASRADDAALSTAVIAAVTGDDFVGRLSDYLAKASTRRFASVYPATAGRGAAPTRRQSAAFRTSVESAYASNLRAMLRRAAGYLAATSSHDELAALTEFFATPNGRQMGASVGAVRTLAATQPSSPTLRDEIEAEIRKLPRADPAQPTPLDRVGGGDVIKKVDAAYERAFHEFNLQPLLPQQERAAFAAAARVAGGTARGATQ